MKKDYKRFITPLYLFNIVFQSLISLVSPVAVMYFIAWLIERYAGVGSWIYVVLILLGVFSGLYSMVVFILRAMAALDSIEKQNLGKNGGKDRNNEQ